MGNWAGILARSRRVIKSGLDRVGNFESLLKLSSGATQTAILESISLLCIDHCQDIFLYEVLLMVLGQLVWIHWIRQIKVQCKYINTIYNL